MDLLKRYLQAVGGYLPEKMKADTLAELQANLEAEMDDKAESLGRPLKEDEEAEVLRRHGHPSILAARYRPKQYLIGPEVFPFYWYVMRKAFPYIIALFVLSQAIGLIYGPPQMHIFATTVVKFISMMLSFAAWMTLIFAVGEYLHGRYPEKVTFHKDWDPRKLAKAEANAEAEGTVDGLLLKHPVVDLIFHVVVTLWLLALPHFPYLLGGPGVRYLHQFSMGVAPVWYQFYWAVVALNCIQVVFKAIMLFRSARPWRRAMKIVEQLFGLFTLFLLLRAREYIVFTGPATNAGRLHFTEALNVGIHRSFELVAVLMVLKVLWDIAQMLRETWQKQRGFAAVL